MAFGVTYLDYQSTTPCDPAVVQAMAPWWTEDFANPASRLHRPGLTAAAVVQQSRSTIAASLGFGPEALIFCSCLLYTSPSPRDQRGSRMPSSA